MRSGSKNKRGSYAEEGSLQRQATDPHTSRITPNMTFHKVDTLKIGKSPKHQAYQTP